MIKKTLILIMTLLPLILLSQNLQMIDFPQLHLNDTLIILLKRNKYEEKVIVTKKVSSIKIEFFKKTLFLQLNEKNRLNEKDKEEHIRLIDDFNHKFPPTDL